MEKNLRNISFIAFNNIMLSIDSIKKLETIALNDTDYALCINDDYKIIRRGKGNSRQETEVIAKVVFQYIACYIHDSEDKEIIFLDDVFAEIADRREEVESWEEMILWEQKEV